MADREYTYPVWGTQGGGLVRQVGDIYIFIEKPDCPGLDVGDTMPEGWGVAPANKLAHKEMDRDDFCDDHEFLNYTDEELLKKLAESAKAIRKIDDEMKDLDERLHRESW